MAEGKSEESLDDVFQKAEEKTQKKKELEEEKNAIREKLTDKVHELRKEEKIDPTNADTVEDHLKRDEFDKARELLSQALQEINFEEEEKQVFADKFSEEWNELQQNIEKMKNSLLELEQEASTEDLISYLFGKHSNLRKTDIRATIEGISNLSDKTFTTNDMAQILSGFEKDLNKSDAEDVIEKIKDEASSQKQVVNDGG